MEREVTVKKKAGNYFPRWLKWKGFARIFFYVCGNVKFKHTTSCTNVNHSNCLVGLLRKIRCYSFELVISFFRCK